MPGIKPIGKAHQRVESKRCLGRPAGRRGHGGNENDGGEGENTSHLEG